MKRAQSASLVVAIVLSAGIVQAQTRIDEKSVEQTLFVGPDAAMADDTNPGTAEDKPLRSLQKAIDLAVGIPTRIVLLPGDCRESITIPGGESLLVIEAQKVGESAISGSDLFTHWTEAQGVYEHAWPHDFGPMLENHFNIDWTPLQRRRELAFIDGKALTQVLTRDELVDGAFCVDEVANKVYLKPAFGVDPRTARVEISVRGAEPYGQERNGALVFIQDRANLVLRGLKVRHTMCAIKQAAVSGKARNLLVEDCNFDWNGGIGCDLQLVGATFRRTTGNWNGERGLGLGLSSQVLYEDCECTNNNWRYGEKINGHDSAGFKAFWKNSDITFLRFRALHNNCSGMWFDWDNGPITIRDSLLEDNRVAGLNYEANRHGLLLSNCVIRNNDNGLMFYGSANVKVEKCAIYGNRKTPDQWGHGGSQIFLYADDRVVKKGDWAQQYLSQGYKVSEGDWHCVLEDYSITDCILEVTEPNQFLIHGGTERADITIGSTVQWCKAIHSDRNTYFDPNTDKGFLNPIATKTWEDDFPQLTLQQWQTRTKQDLNSRWMATDLEAIEDPTAANHVPKTE